jgi:hypothetical protein
MMRERRKNFRLEWNTPALICYGKMTRSCTLGDLSNGGAKIVVIPAETVPNEFTLRLSRRQGGIRPCRVLRRSANTIAVAFTDQMTAADEPHGAAATQELERMR